MTQTEQTDAALFTPALLDMAFRALYTSRRRWPADSDIWHLRFHWTSERPRLLSLLNAGQFRFSAMRVISRADGSRLAVWDACDALVIRCLCLLLTPVLPVSRLCEHVRGHGGGKASVRKVRDRLLSGRYPYVCRTDIRGYYAHIRQDILYDQLSARVLSPVLRNLLYQFLHYSVEDGGGHPSVRCLRPFICTTVTGILKVTREFAMCVTWMIF